MKKMLLALCLVTGFISCKQPATPPTQVLDSMFTAMKNGNVEEMKKYISKSDVNMVETAERIMTKVDPEGFKKIKDRVIDELKNNVQDVQYSFKNEKIDGDHATVETEIIKTDSSGQKKTTHTFELVKEDNAWKIALSRPGNEMFNSMKGDMGPKNGGLKDGIDKLQKMDPDSLKMLIDKGLQSLDSLDKKKGKQ